MDWLNYHHLLYFWSVAKHGTMTKACEKLRLAQPSISGQIHLLENTLGEKLFIRTGRRLALTEMGRLVFKYAEDIFATGQELMNTVKGQGNGHPTQLVVGIADAVPKPLATQLLKSALKLYRPTRLICQEDKLRQLLTDLAAHRSDLVIADRPAPASINEHTYNHPLGQSGVPRRGAARCRAVDPSLRACNTLSEQAICETSSSAKRDAHLLCVVESPSDQLMIEQSLSHSGLYFVLLGRLSPLDGIGPREIQMERLIVRAVDGIVSEVIIATSFTPEGDATAHYVGQLLKERDPRIKVTRLARGVPAGAELEYTDVNTIAQAMLDRRAS